MADTCSATPRGAGHSPAAPGVQRNSRFIAPNRLLGPTSCRTMFGLLLVAGAAGLRRALRGPAPVPPAPTLADGLRVATAGALTTRVCASVLHDVITVGEDEVSAAVRRLAIDEHLVVEGAGAVAFAALGRVRARRPIAIITGGNIDPEKLTAAIAGGAR